MNPALLLVLAWVLVVVPSAGGERPRSGDGRPVPTVGSVVRSREWVIRRAPQREEEFIGDVSYRKGSSTLSSDWALFRHDAQLWQARGRARLVHGLRSGDRIEVSGDKAEYDQKAGRGHLLGPAGGLVDFARFPADGPPDHGSARRLDWEGRERARLTGGVRIWGPRLEVQGEAADYDAQRGTLSVTGGRPVLQVLEGDWTGAVQGDILVASQHPDGLQADGRTQGWIRFKDRLEKLAR